MFPRAAWSSALRRRGAVSACASFDALAPPSFISPPFDPLPLLLLLLGREGGRLAAAIPIAISVADADSGRVGLQVKRRFPNDGFLFRAVSRILLGGTAPLLLPRLGGDGRLPSEAYDLAFFFGGRGRGDR